MLTLDVVNAVADKNNKIVFQFPEYDYKESGKNVSSISLLLFAVINLLKVNKSRSITISIRNYRFVNLNQHVIKANDVKI